MSSTSTSGGRSERSARFGGWRRISPARLVHTENFRLSAIYAALFAGSMFALMALVYLIVQSALREQLLQGIDNDLAQIRAGYAQEGINEAKEVIDQRLQQRGEHGFLLLQDRRGRKIAGDLPAMAPRTQTFVLPHTTATDDGDGHPLIGRGELLPDGSYVFAGRDMSFALQTQNSILGAFAWAVLVVLVVAVAGGAALSFSFLGRMDQITETLRAIMAGRLHDRVPVRGTRDEMDRLASTINEMLDRIALLMESLRQVSSDIAHDLRTPLTQLRHRLERARSEAKSSEDYAAVIEDAIAKSENIFAIFSSLLRIAQIESGTPRSALVSTDLDALVRRIAELYAPAAEDSGHVFSANFASNATVLGDPDLLTQMLANVIENALTHTPAGGRIALSTGREGDKAVIAIADDGPGIPESEHERVFRRFYRLDSSRTKPGSGLGLALVAVIAELHDAKVSLADNRPGLKLTITLPVPDERR